MRQHHHLSNLISYKDEEETIIISADHHHFENATGTINNSTHLSPGHIELSTSVCFTSCEWKSCKGDQANGGAICVHDSSVGLEVFNCLFIFCETSGCYGGGICAFPAHCVHVRYSLFQNCMAMDHFYDAGGGGIFLERVSQEVLIHSTSFVSCKVYSDGGGVNMWYCSCAATDEYSPPNSNTFENCKFIVCEGSTIEEGGGILA